MAKVGGILAPDLEGVNKHELCGKDLWDVTITVSISNFGKNIKKLIAKTPTHVLSFTLSYYVKPSW